MEECYCHYRIDLNQHKALRDRFNPDGSILRKHQLRMLEILQWIDIFCKKHDIKYWLTAGTCLGAVRHQGFIPWDDDIDIEMLRPDYEKFVSLFKENEDLALQTNDTDPFYVVPYAKIRDKHSQIQEPGAQDTKYKYRGIYVDIFILEKCSQPIASICSKLAWKLLIYGSKTSNNKLKIFIYKILKASYKSLLRILRTFDFLIPNKKWIYTYGSGFENITIDMKDLMPLTLLKFEGSLFPCPHNTHQYLVNAYGDYMKLPRLENIHPHINDIKFIEDKM